MRFLKDQLYKVVEMDSALVIIDANDQVTKAQPLMAGQAGHVLSYLDRYFWEREHGTPEILAHERALNTANLGAIELPNFKKMN